MRIVLSFFNRGDNSLCSFNFSLLSFGIYFYVLYKLKSTSQNLSRQVMLGLLRKGYEQYGGTLSATAVR
jgi:hypothetical protein